MLGLLFCIRDCFRSRFALQAEMLALRHQLLVLRRLWSNWRSALMIVKPETVIAWHRRGFRLYWRWKSRYPDDTTSITVQEGPVPRI
jgi:putative transposase